MSLALFPKRISSQSQIQLKIQLQPKSISSIKKISKLLNFQKHVFFYKKLYTIAAVSCGLFSEFARCYQVDSLPVDSSGKKNRHFLKIPDFCAPSFTSLSRRQPG